MDLTQKYFYISEKMSFRLDSFNLISGTIFILIFVTLAVISYQLTSYGSTTAPDFVQNIFFSKQFATTGSLRYCNVLNRKYDTSVFGSRGLKITTDKYCLTHGSMHGFILILSFFQRMSGKMIFIVVPLFSITCLIYFYKTSNQFFDKKSSLIGVLLLLLSPSYFYHSVILFNNIPALCFLSVGLYYYIDYIRSRLNLTKICISFLALSAMVWMRYEYIIFTIPFFLSWLIFVKRKNSSVKTKLLPVGLFLMSLTLLAIVNINLYGGVLKFAGSKETSLSNSPYYNSQQTLIADPNLFQKIGGDIIKTNILRFVVRYNVVIFLLCGYVLYLMIYKKDVRKIPTQIGLIFCWVLIFPILFYLRKIWTGYFEDDVIIANSYVRYLLPSYFIMTIISIGCMRYINNKSKLLFLLFYIYSNVNIVFNSPGAIKDYQVAQKTYVDKQESILKLIPEQDAVVFVSYFDKYIFPKRNTAIYTSFPEEDGIEMTSSLIKRLVLDNIPVYFIDEDWATNYIKYPHDKYFENIAEKGLTINSVSPSIYKITKLEN